MTDFTSRDTTYYSGFQYNNTSDGQDCYINNQLIAPIVNKANDYQVALSKMEIPLSAIPIGGQTNNIIPLKSWEVSIQSGDIIGSAFVRQINPNAGNILYNASQNQLQKYGYTNTGVLAEQGNVVLSPFINQMVVDDYGNSYVTLSQLQGGAATQLAVYSPTGVQIALLNFVQIACMTIDNNQNVIVATDNTVYVYTNVNAVGSVDLTLAATITANKAGTALSGILTVCADGQIIVGYNTNKLTLYNQAFEAVTDYTESSITQLGKASQILATANRFVLNNVGVVDELFFGLKSGTNALVNMVNGSAYAGGSYNSSANMAITGANYVVGVQNSTLTPIQFTPSTQPGSVTASIVPLPTSTPFTALNCVNYPNTNIGIMSNSSTTPKSLYGYKLDNFSEDYFLFDTTFESFTGNQVKNYAISSTTNNMFITDSVTSALQVSALPYSPKMLLLDTTAVNSLYNVQTTQMGFGWNNPNTSSQTLNSTYTCVNTSTDMLRNYGFVFPSEGQYAYTFIANPTATVITVIPYAKNNLSTALPGGYNLLNFNSVLMYPTSFCQVVDIGNNHFAISGDWAQNGGLDEYKVFIYRYGNATPVADGVVYGALLGPTTKPFLSSILESDGKNFLAVANGRENNVYILDVTNPSIAPINVQAVRFVTPLPTNAGGFYGMSIINGGAIAGVINYQLPNANPFYQLTYAQGMGANFAGTPTFISGGIAFLEDDIIGNANLNCLQSNTLLSELYLILANQTICTYKFSNGATSLTLTSTMASPIEILPNCNFYNVLQNVSDVYLYVAVQLLPAGLVTGIVNFAFSPKHPYVMYVINLADNKVYRGVLQQDSFGSYSLTNLTLSTTITDTFTTINVVSNTSNIVSSALLFQISDQSAVGTAYSTGGSEIISIARNEVTNEFILSLQTGSQNIVSLNTVDATVNFTTTMQQVGPIWSKNAEDFEAGAYPVYGYEPIIANVNIALAEAWQNFANAGGVQPGGSTPPVMSYNYQTGYLTLSYNQALSGSLAVAPTTFINFSQPLLQYFYFYNVQIGTTNQYQIVLPLGSSSATQSAKSLFLLNTLAQLILVSDTIFVDSSFQGNNILNRNIATIDIPKDTIFAGNYDQILEFVPTFLRTFKLASNQAIQNLTFRLNYQTKDGNQYTVELPPNESWTFIVMFIKRV